MHNSEQNGKRKKPFHLTRLRLLARRVNPQINLSAKSPRRRDTKKLSSFSCVLASWLCVEKPPRWLVGRVTPCVPSLVCGRLARRGLTRPTISQRQRRDIFVEHPHKKNHKLRRSDIL